MQNFFFIYILYMNSFNNEVWEYNYSDIVTENFTIESECEEYCYKNTSDDHDWFSRFNSCNEECMKCGGPKECKLKNQEILKSYVPPKMNEGIVEIYEDFIKQ